MNVFREVRIYVILVTEKIGADFGRFCSDVYFNDDFIYQCLSYWRFYSNVYRNDDFIPMLRGRRGRMVVGFTTTYGISAYHHWCCEFESWSGRGVQHCVIKFLSDLRQVDRRYNRNIVESAVKHHQTNIFPCLSYYLFVIFILLLAYNCLFSNYIGP